METTSQGIIATIKKATIPTETTDVVVKGRKSRGPKLRPPFYPLSSTNAILEHKLGGFLYAPRQTSGEVRVEYTESFIINPYTSLIPVLYLLLGNDAVQMEHVLRGRSTMVGSSEVADMMPKYPYIVKKLSTTHKHLKMSDLLRKFADKMSSRRFIGELAYRHYRFDGMRYSEEYIKIELEKWLKYDHWHSLSHIFSFNRITNTHADVVHEPFASALSIPHRKSRMRSYECVVSPLSIFLKNQATSGYNPSVIATILPENYMYQKYHIIAKNTLDLSKVTVLVDRELDNPEYPIPAFRRMYKQRCEPVLKTLGCQTLKVPVEFMKENCFVPPFKIQEKSRSKREIEKNELISKFYEKFSEEFDIQEDMENQLEIENNEEEEDFDEGDESGFRTSVNVNSGVYRRYFNPAPPSYVTSAGIDISETEHVYNLAIGHSASTATVHVGDVFPRHTEGAETSPSPEEF